MIRYSSIIPIFAVVLLCQVDGSFGANTSSSPASQAGADPVVLGERLEDAIVKHNAIVETSQLRDLETLGKLAVTDTKAEDILKRLAQHKPFSTREELTLAGHAFMELQKVRAEQRFREVVKGADTPEKELALIKNAIDQHPDWLAPNAAPDNEEAMMQHILVSRLVFRAVELGGGKEIPLLIRTQLLSADLAEKHSDALLDYAGKLDRNALVRFPKIVDYLAWSKNAKALTLLSDWLKGLGDLSDPKEKDLARVIVGGLADLPGDGTNLLPLLEDARPFVVVTASACISNGHPDSRSLEAMRKALQHLKEIGASPDSLDLVGRHIKAVEEGLKNK